GGSASSVSRSTPRRTAGRSRMPTSAQAACASWSCGRGRTSSLPVQRGRSSVDDPTVVVFAYVLTKPEARTLVLVLLATTLGALLSRLHRKIVVPTVVVEIVLGIVIGPEVLGAASAFSFLTILSNFGLALLFFFAGLEVVEQRVERHAVVR